MNKNYSEILLICDNNVVLPITPDRLSRLNLIEIRLFAQPNQSDYLT
jgi:hypothetical protein